MNWKNVWLRMILVLGIMVAIPATYLYWGTLSFVHDPHDEVSSAFLEGYQVRQPMSDYPFGWFVARTAIEGHFLVICKNGKSIETGYVSFPTGGTLRIDKNCEYGGITY